MQFSNSDNKAAFWPPSSIRYISCLSQPTIKILYDMGSPFVLLDPSSPAALYAYVGRQIEFLMIGRLDRHENRTTILDPVFTDKGPRPDHDRQARFHCADSHLVFGCHLDFGRWSQGSY